MAVAVSSDLRSAIVANAGKRGLSLAAASHMIGRPGDFLSRYVVDQVAAGLNTQDRRHLALCLDLDLSDADMRTSCGG